MPRGMGRALEKALAHEQGETPRGTRESLLMHPQRREIFRLLCLHPCATVAELSHAAKLSANGVRWHLERMVHADLVVRAVPGTFHPKGFIDPADGAIFRTLSEPAARDVFRAVLEAPGSTQKELCTALAVSRQTVFKATASLLGHKLLTSIEDGRFRRYYPTGLLFDRREENRTRSRAFADSLVKRLQVGGLAPHVLRRTENQILVRITQGRTAEVLDLPLDPFTTTLQ